jgi:hypothetical protein
VYHLTRHAEARLRERQLTVADVEAALRSPAVSYRSRGAIVLCAEDSITVVVRGSAILTAYRRGGTPERRDVP